MEPGSIQETFETLRRWCVRTGWGWARVGWDSAISRERVTDQLRGVLSDAGIPFQEVELPAGKPSGEVVMELWDKLRAFPPGAVSITGVEWAYPEGGALHETLGGLNFYRDALGSLPLRQIWWMPEHIAEQFAVTIPDFESWFRLRLHLTEALPARSPAEALTLPEAPSLSTAEASRLADQLAERIKNAERNGIPAERIWSQLGRPLLQVLEQGGLAEQQQYWLTRFAGYRALLNEHVQSLEREEGETSIETLLAMVDLAKLAQEQGDLTEAVRLWSSILERFRRKPGENDDNILLAMGGLAIALAEQGNLTSAGKLQAEILRLEEGRFGVDHPDLLRPLNNLGITLRHHGDYAGARRVLERALGIAQRSLREGDPSRLQLMMNLANTLTEQGDFAAAERLLQQVVERYSRELGPNHSNTLKAKLNLAVALKHQKHQGEWEAAKRLEQTVVECSRRLMGEKHPFAARAASNLLLTLLGQGAFSEAKALFHSSLEWVIAADPSSWSADLIQLRSQLQDLLPQLQEAPAETPQSRSE